MKKEQISPFITTVPGNNYNVYTAGGHAHTGRQEGTVTNDLLTIRRVVHMADGTTHERLTAIDINFITAIEELP